MLFLVDRGNLARQTKKEFDAYASPHNAYKFGEEFIVQHLQGNQLDGSARVVICTIQRMFSMLKVRRHQKRGDYSDPGWYQHPPGTVAYEFTGALPDPARFKADASPGPGSMPAMAKPAQDVEVKVRKPAGGHSGH